MKKSELKSLLRIIVKEAIQSKGLSGFKKSSEKVEHTEKVADSKTLTPNSEPKEKKEGKKLPVKSSQSNTETDHFVSDKSTPQPPSGEKKEGKALPAGGHGSIKEGFGDMLQGYADWSLFIKDAFAVGAVSLAFLLAGYLWLSDKIKAGIRKFVVKRFGAELDTYLTKRADEIRNDPGIQKALADPKHTGLYLAIKAKLNQQDLEMNQKVRKVLGKDIVPSLARAVDAPSATPAQTSELKEQILQMIREEIEEYRTKGALGASNPNRTTAVKTYVKQGTNPNLGRPKKSETPGAGPNTKVGIRFDGEDLDEIDMRLVKGSFFGYLKSYLSGRNIQLGLYKIDPSVQIKLDALSDAYMDDNLPQGTVLDLQVDKDTVKAL